MIQPRRGIARRAVLRPALQRPQAGVLERLLGGVEVAENSAARRRPPGDEPKVSAASIQAVSVTAAHSGPEQADGTDLIGAAGIGRAEIARDGNRFVGDPCNRRTLEAEQLFLGLGIGAIEHQRRIILAQRWSPPLVGSSRATGPSRPCWSFV